MKVYSIDPWQKVYFFDEIRKKPKKTCQKIGKIEFDALLPSPSNGEDHKSLPCSYQKLFKRYPYVFFC